MARERPLPNAPIREAVLDLRFPAAEATDLEALRDALTSLDDFDQISKPREASAAFRFSPEEGPKGHVEQGTRFVREHSCRKTARRRCSTSWVSTTQASGGLGTLR